MNGDNLSQQACLSIGFEKVKAAFLPPVAGNLLKVFYLNCVSTCLYSHFTGYQSTLLPNKVVLPSPHTACFYQFHGWHKYGCNQTSSLSKSWKQTWPGAEKWVVPAGGAQWMLSSRHLLHVSTSPKQRLSFQSKGLLHLRGNWTRYQLFCPGFRQSITFTQDLSLKWMAGQPMERGASCSLVRFSR